VNVRRGDIVLVDLDPTKGSEQRGRRPAVVIQNDTGNRVANTTIIAPLTTSYDPETIAPYEAELRAEDTPVKEDSVALCNQIRTVSIEHRIEAKFGTIDDRGMADIEHAIEVSLGLL
jgi:mRNA interferase MazF